MITTAACCTKRAVHLHRLRSRGEQMAVDGQRRGGACDGTRLSAGRSSRREARAHSRCRTHERLLTEISAQAENVRPEEQHLVLQLRVLHARFLQTLRAQQRGNTCARHTCARLGVSTAHMRARPERPPDTRTRTWHNRAARARPTGGGTRRTLLQARAAQAG